MKERVILAPLSKIHGDTADCLSGEYKSCKSRDSVKDKQEGGNEFTMESLNSTEIGRWPRHDFKLKNNMIIMLMHESRIAYKQACRVPRTERRCVTWYCIVSNIFIVSNDTQYKTISNEVRSYLHTNSPFEDSSANDVWRLIQKHYNFLSAQYATHFCHACAVLTTLGIFSP